MKEEDDGQSPQKVAISSGQSVVMDGREWAVRSGFANVVFVDFLTEARQINGVVYVSVGSASVDFDNQPVIEVHTRLRMDIVTAQVLHTTLGNLIRDSQQPPDKSVAN